MGIRGLSTFFNSNPHLSKRYQLHDTQVIIDGNNLMHLLYHSNQLDCIYGGDYKKYASMIKNYFASFSKCNIKPIVIFDGGYDKSDRKFNSCLLRSKKRLTCVQRIARYGRNGKVLPINARTVFRDVLLEMEVKFAQCDFEADEQIAALANHYNCPVISDDSDFYIYDIHKGFIRLSSVDTNVSKTSIDGKDIAYLLCEFYHIDKFLSHFPGINRNILPLFATLIGNDYTDSGVFANFFANVQLPKPKGQGLKVGQNQREIIGLLLWLSNYDLNGGLEKILNHFKKVTRDQVAAVIKRSVEGYDAQNCNLMSVIDGKVDGSNAYRPKTKLTTLCNSSLPMPFLVSFHTGQIPSFFMNIIIHHRTFLLAQVESLNSESSYMCSQYVRQVIYGILLQHSFKDLKIHQEACLKNIAEYDHRHGNIHRKEVEPIYVSKTGCHLPSLPELYSMEISSLCAIMLNVLDIDACLLSPLPDCLALLFGCVVYWLKNSNSTTTEDFINALLLNIIYFHIIPQKAKKNKDTIKCNAGLPHNSKSCIEIFDEISEPEIDFAVKNMKKYLTKPVLNRGNPLLLSIIHNFSQLQTCILYISYLNKLLRFPFKHIQLHRTFSGTMLYNLTTDLSSRRSPGLFIPELLGGNSKLLDVFNHLKNVLMASVDDCIERSDRSHIKKKKRGGKAKNRKKNVLVDADAISETIENDESNVDPGEIFI